jgi:hypothetical protein
MKKLLFIISLVLTQVATKAQDIPKDTILLADETTLTYSKTGATIHTFNESVFNDLYKSHNALFKRYTCTWKKDRFGRYRDYTIHISKDDAELIQKWANKNL